MTFDELETNGRNLHADRDWVDPSEDLGDWCFVNVYTLDEADIERLRSGQVLELSAQGEYSVYVRLASAARERTSS